MIYRMIKISVSDEEWYNDEAGEMKVRGVGKRLGFTAEIDQDILNGASRIAAEVYVCAKLDHLVEQLRPLCCLPLGKLELPKEVE